MPVLESFGDVSTEQLASWNRERSTEELHTLLGRRLATVALDNMTDDEDEDASAYDLLTV